MMIPFYYEIIIYIIVPIGVNLHNHNTCMHVQEAVHFPSPIGALPDPESNCIVMVINSFVGIIDGSTNPMKMTVFDTLFDLLSYLREEIYIPLI